MWHPLIPFLSHLGRVNSALRRGGLDPCIHLEFLSWDMHPPSLGSAPLLLHKQAISPPFEEILVIGKSLYDTIVIIFVIGIIQRLWRSYGEWCQWCGCLMLCFDLR
jgi:hypothetical protein